jgi:hypothetical protein
MKPLKEKHFILDCFYWNLFGLIPLLSACFAIARTSINWMVIYLVVYAGHFLIIEYRFFCSHCPHYCNSSETTNCMFLWSIPKYFQKRPHALHKYDITMVIFGFVIVIFFPLPWLLKSHQLCILYFLSWAVFAMTLKRYECVRCIYFDCPANSVDENTKEVYKK